MSLSHTEREVRLKTVTFTFPVDKSTDFIINIVGVAQLRLVLNILYVNDMNILMLSETDILAIFKFSKYLVI